MLEGCWSLAIARAQPRRTNCPFLHGMQPSAAPASVGWHRLSDMSIVAKELLQGAGITAAVAKRLMDELGFTCVGDVQGQ